MTREIPYVVVGAGAIGSAATYWLSRRAGGDVLCLEQWELGHERAASEDHSRIIRHGYHAERYTALTADAYAAWHEVEAESGVPLVHVTGIVNVGQRRTPGGDVLDDYEAAMAAHDIPSERMDAAELMRRWPQFRAPADHDAVFQAEGGILDVRRAGAVLRALASARGATFAPQTPVVTIRPQPGGVELETAAGAIRAQHVVLAAGAWNPRLLATFGAELPIELSHEQVTYFHPRALRDYAPGRFPTWIWHGDGAQDAYGFPVYGEVATKAAIEDLRGGASAGEGDWEPDPGAVARLRQFLGGILPGYAERELRTRVCLYDMPPDRDFVLDFVPGHDRVALAVGAGHAAKFAALLGRILAELTLDGATDAPIAPFAADRPALTDPGFAPVYRLGGGVPAPG